MIMMIWLDGGDDDDGGGGRDDDDDDGCDDNDNDGDGCDNNDYNYDDDKHDDDGQVCGQAADGALPQLGEHLLAPADRLPQWSILSCWQWCIIVIIIILIM